MARKKGLSDSPASGRDRSDDLRRRSLSALSKTSLVVLADRTIQIISLAVTARLLLPAEIAVVAAGGTVVSLLGLISTLGMPAFLIQVATLTPSIQAATRTMLVITIALTVGLVEVFAPIIGEWFQNPQVADALRVMVLILVAPVFSAAALARLSRDLRAKDVALADLAANATGVGLVTIPLAVADFGFWALAYGAVAQIFLRTVILCVLARQPLGLGVDLHAIADVVRRSAGFMLNILLTRLETDTPHWIVGRYLATADLGLFSRANSLMSYPAGLFYAIVDRVIFPAVALVQNQAERLREGALDAVRVTAVVGVSVTAALFFLGGDLIRIVLGPNWEGAVAPFQILCLATYFKLASRLNWIILRGLGRTYGLAVVQAVLLIITAIVCFLATQWGLRGVAAAVTAMICVTYLASGVLAMRAANISIPAWISAHAQSLASGVLVAAVLAPLVAFLDAKNAPPIVVVACGIAALPPVGALAVWLAPQVFLGQAGMTVLRSALGALIKRRRASA